MLALTVAVAAAGCGKVKGDGGSPDAGGECTAATEATACATHEVCDTSGGPGVCACAPAYAKNSSGACVFAGAPADPGLADPGRWLVAGTGPVVDPNAPGNADPGEAVFDRPSLCSFATISQTFTMPPLDRAEPLKLNVTHSASQPPQQFDLLDTLISIGVGTQWTDLRVQPSAYRTDSICLGAAAYGGPIKFQVGMIPSAGLSCNSPVSSPNANIRIDQLQVVPATLDECPAPGSVLNGDFEGPAGWTFTPIIGATGALVAGAGEGGTKGAQLATANKCSQATMTGTASFPTRAMMANPAIDLFWSAPPGERIVFQIGGKNIATLTSSGGNAGHSHVCVPAWAVGSVQSVGVFVQQHSDNACNTAYAETVNIDNMSIVNDAKCTETGDLTDPGFERVSNVTGPVTGWGETNNYINDTQGLITTVVNQPAAAHSGTGALRMFWGNQCTTHNEAGADLTFVVPASDATGGPAVKFFANVAASNTVTEARLSMLPLPFGLNVFTVTPRNGAYTAQVMCLPPKLSGRRITLRAGLGSDGGACATMVSTETALYDDFVIGTDAACPAVP
ncbi:MAG TPA: hypothetical protein VFP84_04580 [Kofleriaceae bacterium]|nr:hypothetical protein [Kofleriaceae bacterium]